MPVCKCGLWKRESERISCVCDAWKRSNLAPWEYGQMKSKSSSTITEELNKTVQIMLIHEIFEQKWQTIGVLLIVLFCFFFDLMLLFNCVYYIFHSDQPSICGKKYALMSMTTTAKVDNIYNLLDVDKRWRNLISISIWNMTATIKAVFFLAFVIYCCYWIYAVALKLKYSNGVDIIDGENMYKKNRAKYAHNVRSKFSICACVLCTTMCMQCKVVSRFFLVILKIERVCMWEHWTKHMRMCCLLFSACKSSSKSRTMNTLIRYIQWDWLDSPSHSCKKNDICVHQCDFPDENKLSCTHKHVCTRITIRRSCHNSKNVPHDFYVLLTACIEKKHSKKRYAIRYFHISK